MSLQILELFSRHQTQPLTPRTEFLGPFELSLTQFQTGLARDVWQLSVGCGNFRVNLLPTRGMSIHEVFLDDFRFGWLAPQAGPVHPRHVPIQEPSGLGWLDGFTELLVRCGLTSNGAPQFSKSGILEYPLHGRIGNLPAQSLEVHWHGSCLDVVAEIDELRFHFHKWRLTTRYRFVAGETRVQVQDTVTNLSGRTADFQMLYHFNLGSPLLEAGGLIEAGLVEQCPRNRLASDAEWERWVQQSEVLAPNSMPQEQVTFARPLGDHRRRSLAMVSNRAHAAAAAIEFDVEELPCLTFWKNYVDSRDGYVLGLEPGTNFPNPRDFEMQQGRTRPLAAGQSTALHWDLHFANTSEAVARLSARVQDMQRGTIPHVHRHPRPDWSAGA